MTTVLFSALCGVLAVAIMALRDSRAEVRWLRGELRWRQQADDAARAMARSLDQQVPPSESQVRRIV